MATPVTFVSQGGRLAGAARTTSNVVIPGSLVAGNIMIAALYMETLTAPTGIPAGFTELTGFPVALQSGGPSVLRLYTKTVVGGEVGPLAFTHASTFTAGWAAQYTATDGIDIIDSDKAVARTDAMPAMSGNTTVASTRLLYIGHNYNSATVWTNPGAGFTVRLSTTGETILYDKDQPTAGATGAITATPSGNDWNMAVLLGLRPAGSATSQAVRVGASVINAARVGANAADKLYIGTTQVWP